MAAATLSSARIDLGSKETYPIRLGPSILKPKEAKKLTSVRYNHIPIFKDAKRVHSILRSGKDGAQERLVLKDGAAEYIYVGKNVGSGDKYILLYRKDGNDKELVLERLDACHDFNLIKTPTEPDAAKLVAKFPQLSFDEPDDEDLFGDGGDAEEPVDPSNPWDYRNYLKSSVSKPRGQNAAAKGSATSTSQAHSRAASSTPVSRPVKRSETPLVSQKRKAPENSKTNPKRVKAGTEPPTPASVSSKPAQSKPKSGVPKVHVEHKRVALPKASLDNSGELILELATPITEKPPKQPSAMALALSGQLGQGPISLHSAASSPASRVASPNPPRPEGMGDGEEFDIGASSSPEAPVKSQATLPDEDYFGGDGEDDADADVEDFELPSPAQTHGRRKSIVATTATGDDDDDLEQQMMAAMADDDDDGVAVAPPLAESDEESEEE